MRFKDSARWDAAVAPALRGTAGSEPRDLLGTDKADTLNGGSGNDMLEGLRGNDELNGRAGDDFLIGNEGADTLRGGAGDDEIWSDITFFPGIDAKPDQLFGGAGNDYLVGDRNDTVLGGSGNDTLRGAAAGALIDGGAGDDVFLVGGYGQGGEVRGGSGDDEMQVFQLHDAQIDTGAGNDLVYMVGNSESTQVAITLGSGDDTLLLDGVHHQVDSGRGDDRIAMSESFFGDSSARITTGAGADVIAPGVDGSFSSAVVNLMTVLDFDTRLGADRIDLADLNAKLGLVADADPFASGNARLAASGHDTLLETDPSGPVDGDNFIAVLRLEGLAPTGLSPDNFVQTVSLPTRTYADTQADTYTDTDTDTERDLATGPGWGHSPDAWL